jgi:hypothetical protein
VDRRVGELTAAGLNEADARRQVLGSAALLATLAPAIRAATIAPVILLQQE